MAPPEATITCFFFWKLPGAREREDGRRNFPPSSPSDGTSTLISEVGSEEVEEEAAVAGETVMVGMDGAAAEEEEEEASVADMVAAIVDMDVKVEVDCVGVVGEARL